MGSPAENEPLIQPRHLVFLASIALLPMLGAQFGYGNQAEQIPLIKRLIDPELYGRDFYVNSGATLGQPRFYYALLISWLHRVLPLPVVFHGLSLLTNFSLGVVTFGTARRFLRVGPAGAAVAATLAIVNSGFTLGYAAYLRFDSYQPASLAVAAALWAFFFSLQKRHFLTCGCALFACVIHPTIGAELGLLAFGSTFVADLIERRTFRNLAPVVSATLLFLVGIFVVWGLPNLGAAPEHLPEGELFAILAQFRAPHHYLAAWLPLSHLKRASVFVLVLCSAFYLFVRTNGWNRASRQLATVAITVLGLCVASPVFVDILHNRPWMTAQVFRVLMLVKWIGYLYLGWLSGFWLKKFGARGAILAACMIYGSADASPYVLATVFLGGLALESLDRSAANKAHALRLAGIAVVAIAVALTFRFDRQYGSQTERVRSLLAGMIFLGTFVIPKIRNWAPAAGAALALTTVVVGYLTRHEGLLNRKYLTAEFGWSDLRSEADQMARVARQSSPRDAIWLVPPAFEMFSAISERAVVVNFTAIPFDEQAIREWRTRLEVLYGPTTKFGFGALAQMKEAYSRGVDVALAKERYGADFAVLPVEAHWQGPVIAQNEKYKAVRLP